MAAKRTKRKAPKKNKKPPAGRVTVRMFCQGLGDCFLITLPQGKGKRDYHIMIDCGVAMGTPDASPIMNTVVRKIQEFTGGTIDLLVVTHQHWDHVSGFVQAEESLRDIHFRHIWLAWTEDEDDGLAEELRDKHTKAKATLAAGLKLGLSLPDAGGRSSGLHGILAFGGPAASVGKGLDAAMSIARSLATGSTSAPPVRCLRPGVCENLPGSSKGSFAHTVNAFVLGPPRDAKKLTRINPDKKEPETYEKVSSFHAALSLDGAWSAGLEEAGPAAFDRFCPFDSGLGISLDDAKKHDFFRTRYFDGGSENENESRRIDADWLWNGIERLALKMDSYTNNTSLVLALELPSREVLLFPGDAQVGNWLSWHDQPYTSQDGRTLTAGDILEKTVLYKVGHHGSHNATLKENGLELMTNPRLTALLPVESDAVERLRYGEMPLNSLVKALREHCHGRVLRLDEAWSGGVPPGSWDAPRLIASVSAETIEVETKETGQIKRPLYIEYVLCDAAG